jgi:hypothetical protein
MELSRTFWLELVEPVNSTRRRLNERCLFVGQVVDLEYLGLVEASIVRKAAIGRNPVRFKVFTKERHTAHTVKAPFFSSSPSS